jgi:hypothetical protein
LPEVSRFRGIVIGMFYKDHNPPHFHAYHGDDEAAIAIQDGRVLWGGLPQRCLGYVQEWRAMHVVELEDDWQLAMAHQPLRRIDPLE